MSSPHEHHECCDHDHGTGKKNKKDKKKKGSEAEEASSGAPAVPQPLSIADQLKLEEQILNLTRQLKLNDHPSGPQHNYKFWNTQPVPKLDEKVTENTYIDAPVPIEKIQKDPYPLQAGFQWANVDLKNEDELKELYKLLSENYVEDDDNMFRFAYSPEFLRWALLPPGWRPEWHCGVRAGVNNRLVAFIGAIPCNLKVYDKEVKGVEINFLCIHKKLRSHRMAPVLIKEITRRVNLTGIFQAAFTAGIILPKPIARCRYYHRTLNPKKLIDTGFSSLQRNMNMARTIKLYKLPDETTTKLVPLTAAHIPSAYKLLVKYLSKFSLYPLFTEDEFKHFMTPVENVVYAYVLTNGKGEVTDMCSFYSLPSSVVNHPVHNMIYAAYSFYNVAETVDWNVLMKDALILAKKNNFDVFNALDIMENEKFLQELKFGIGDGMLQYYLYNWKCPDLQPKDLAFVLQ